MYIEYSRLRPLVEGRNLTGGIFVLCDWADYVDYTTKYCKESWLVAQYLLSELTKTIVSCLTYLSVLGTTHSIAA